MSVPPPTLETKLTSCSHRYLAGCTATPSAERGAPGEEPAQRVRAGQVSGIGTPFP